jgi:hypothetical protein
MEARECAIRRHDARRRRRIINDQQEAQQRQEEAQRRKQERNESKEAIKEFKKTHDTTGLANIIRDTGASTEET